MLLILKRIKWKNVTIALIIVFLSIFLAIKTVTYAFNSKDKEIKTTVENVPDSNIYKGFSLSTEKKDSPDFTSAITLPQTNIEEVDKEIIDWANKVEKNFYNEIKKSQKNSKDDDFTANLNIETEILEVTDNLAALILDVSEDFNNEKTENEIKTFIVSIEKEKTVEMNDLFDLKELKSNDYLYKLVDNELKKDKDVYESIDHKGLKKIINKQKEITLGLNKTELLLYFQEGEIAPISIGTITVNIPIEKFNNSMNNQFAKDINVDEIIRIAKEKEAEKIRIAKEKEEEKKRLIEANKIAEAEKKERKENLKELDSDKKYIALTFDDGPSSHVTPRVLDHLDKYNVVATFYMLGREAKKHPKIAKDVADRGHEIASHSVTHADLTSVGADKVNTEISDASSLIEQATGVKPQTFRPPYGAINKNVRNKVTEMNLPIVLWSVDSFDWKHRSKYSVYSKTVKKIHPGAIVLMHDIHPTTADALPSVLEELKDQGYEFVTVTDLLQLTGEQDIGPYNSKKRVKKTKN